MAIALAAGSVITLAGAAPAFAKCSAMSYLGKNYTVCDYPARIDGLRLFLNDENGKNWGSFSRLSEAMQKKGLKLVFAMNAGMYHKDYSPVGLYIENGDQKKRASTRGGPGNFHLLPNGVFYINGRGAGVMETKRFLRRKVTATYATQSGPMLVINGRIHPRFRPQSDSEKTRNGVGLCRGNRVKFAISDDPVNFHAFARLFRDRLRCRNALFLDGSVSKIHVPALDRSDGWLPMGPIVGIVRKIRGAATGFTGQPATASAGTASGSAVEQVTRSKPERVSR